MALGDFAGSLAGGFAQGMRHYSQESQGSSTWLGGLVGPRLKPASFKLTAGGIGAGIGLAATRRRDGAEDVLEASVMRRDKGISFCRNGSRRDKRPGGGDPRR